MDRFNWSVRVTSTDRDTASVYVRNSRLDVGAPLRFDEEYDRVTAFECFLGAIGADLANGLQVVCRERRIEVHGVEAVVQGELNNPLVHLGVVGEEGHPGLESASVKVYVSAVAEEQRVRDAWQETIRRSPLVSTLGRCVELGLSLEVVI